MVAVGVIAAGVAVIGIFCRGIVAQTATSSEYTIPTFPPAPAAGSTILGGSGLTVDLGYGVYTGVHNSTTGLNVWKGVRFAAPPVGNLRWQPPQLPPKNRTEVTANTFGPACPQALPSVPNAAFIPGNEDCLYLNVYAPPGAKKLPVLFWIHGGGYGLGDGTQDMTEIINDNNKAFIVVSIQYRLGAFGFLSSAEVQWKGTANAGILDQAFALAWVQNYIELFGGDASKVTISGESAGGGSVMYHTVAANGKLGTKLFRNGIAASPYLIAQYNYDAQVPTSRYRDFALKAGCKAKGPVFDCLVSKDTMTLQMANYNVTTEQTYGTWAFLPVTDGSYITDLASVLLATKHVNGENVLVGNNADEGPLFVPSNISTQNDLLAWLAQEFPSLTPANLTSILAAYPSTSAPVNPSDPKFETNGLTPPTAVNVSETATGQLQRAYDIYAEATFVCPSYWLASAFSSNSGGGASRLMRRRGKAPSGTSSWHYQYSVPFASHGADVTGYFGPATPSQSRDFVLAFRHIWGNFITGDDPSISNALANGASSPNPDAPNGASSWPKWTDGKSPKQLNLNITGGTPYKVTESWGAVITQFMEPGLRNSISVVDAGSWEGGRGQRCDFWKAISPWIPQ